MQRRNFLKKALLAIPFVGLLAMVGKTKSGEAQSGEELLVDGQVPLIWTPEEVYDYLQKYPNIKVYITQEQWEDYKNRVRNHSKWKDAPGFVVSRNSDGTINAAYNPDKVRRWFCGGQPVTQRTLCQKTS